MGFSLGTVVPSPSPSQGLEWILSLKVFLFPASGDDIYRLSRAPPLLHYLVRNAWQPYITRLRVWVNRWDVSLLVAACIKFFVRLQWWGPCLYFPSGHSFYCNTNIPMLSVSSSSIIELFGLHKWNLLLMLNNSVFRIKDRVSLMF